MNIITKEELEFRDVGNFIGSFLVVDRKIVLGDVEYASGILVKNGVVIRLTRQEEKFLKLLEFEDDFYNSSTIKDILFPNTANPIQSLTNIVRKINGYCECDFIINKKFVGYMINGERV